MAGTNRDSELVAALTVSFLHSLAQTPRFHLLKRLSDY